MEDFITILPLQAPLDRQGLRRLAIHACLELHRVRWLRCYPATDGTRMLCWYQAGDAESVRLVLRQQGCPGLPVWHAEVLTGEPERIGDRAADRIVVEMALEPLQPRDAGELTARVADAMATVGCSPAQTLVCDDGRRLLCVADGGDPQAVAQSLAAAGVEPADVWPCIELDPQPAALFETQPAESGRRAEAVRKADGPTAPANLEVLDAVIIGAGISGICALERFARMGLTARVYESASDVGGVWHWNRYPGARMDSEVHTYVFAFSEELVREWDWQELFAAQPEIASYLRHVADRFDLRPHIRFGHRVTAATYDDRARVWHIETHAGERVAARFLIAAAGTLSAPQMPDYPGMHEFLGQSCHTARWPESGMSLSGKRVAVIGTGASGVQVIQTIADDVAQLTVFQRTPTYCIPQRNHPLTDAERRQIRDDWQQILATCRESYGGFIHVFDPRSGLAVSAAERECVFEALWQRSGFAFWLGNFADLMMNLEVNGHATEFLRGKIRARVRDAETARRLLPDHPLGAKRVPLENGYYEVYNRSNVRLVDLRETPIERITRRGVRTTREEHPLDVIIYATGFDAGTGSLTRIDIRGEAGQSLTGKWRDGPRTFLGLLVNGFPNLFIVNGPHNAAALCNAGRCVEQNVDWIARCIGHMRSQGASRVAASAWAEQEWTTHVYDVAEASVLAVMKQSWFFGANTPGKPQRANIYAAGAREYRRHCEAVAAAGFTGLELS